MIIFGVENWDDLKEEISPLLFDHWNEVERETVPIKLDPDFEKLAVYNSLNMLHIVTVRDNQMLVGYHGSIIDTMIHYKGVLAAHSNLYWVQKNYRKGAIGIRLFQEVERTLKLRNVKMIYDNTKLTTGLDHGKIFERLGHTPIERLYGKWIGD